VYRSLLFIALLLALGLLVNCAAAPTDLNVEQSANNTTVTLPTGRMLNVKLSSNATTGYKWVLTSQPDPQILENIGDSYQAPQNGAPGQGGTETWSFKGIKAGQTGFVLQYEKPFAPTDNPGDTFSLTVLVK